MKILTRLFAVVIVGLLLWTLATLGQQPERIPQPKDAPAALQAGVDVQTRGPIHEAFAQPGSQTAAPAPIVAKKPPEPIEELPPDQKPEGDHVQWIPGYWAWDEDRADYLWVSGIWREPPPDHRWVPGYWLEAQGGWRWVSGGWQPQAQTAFELLPAPPAPIQEAIPPSPSADSIYMPGTWVYQDNRYGWRPGYWFAGRPGWVWTPARYLWTPGGYLFVGGYWDHDLIHRGLCFAPVYFTANVYGQPGWYYRPRYAISADFLLSSLFVRLATGQYYFGDYYDPLYTRRGYAPWVDYRVRGNIYDPLFSYYRWQNRGNAGWENQLRSVYTTRRDNTASRPPRTLTQQANAKVQVVTPLEKWQGTTVKLHAVPKAQQEVLRKNAEHLRDLGRQRGKIETEHKPIAPKGKPVEVTAPRKIELPKTAIKTPELKKKPPPPPDVPKVLPKPPAPPKVLPKEKGKSDVPKALPKEKGKPADHKPKNDKSGQLYLSEFLMIRAEWLLIDPWIEGPRHAVDASRKSHERQNHDTA